MVKKLRLYRDGTISVAQMPHLNEGYVHVLATPTSKGLLYYVCHRKNLRTRIMTVLAGGFRGRDKAFQALSKQIRVAKDVEVKHDPMVKRVYAWEDTYVTPFFSKERLTKDQMMAMIYRVCGDFQIDPPEIIFVRNGKFCFFSRCEQNRPILIYSDAVEFSNTAVILHELAHYMTDLISPGIDNHGAIFLREYLRLLITYTTFTLEELTPSLKKANVAYRLPNKPFIRRI